MINKEDKTFEHEVKNEDNNLSPALMAAMKELLNAKVKDIVAFTHALAKEAGIDLNAVASSQSAAPEEAKEEKTEFTVNLVSYGDASKKIAVIKATKEILPELGLMDAKKLVESADAAPVAIKIDIKKEEAEAIKLKLEAVGATVSFT